jgi:hypothetical protein
MHFINNWITQLLNPMTADAVSLPIPAAALERLGDGEYLLTLVNSANPVQQNAWEVVKAKVVGGAVTLARAQEGTAAQSWPPASIVYCGITAGALMQINAAIESLTARVAALEGSGGGSGGGGGTPSPDGGLVDSDGNTLVDDQGNQLSGA